MLTKNMRVIGKYLGQYPVSGKVYFVKPVTVKTDGCFQVMVVLDAPIAVYGAVRESLIFCVKGDGTPSTYAGGLDFLEVQQ